MAKTCPRCGAAVNRDTAKICNACGKELALPQNVYALCGCASTKKPCFIRFEHQTLSDWEGWVFADAFEARQKSVDRGGYEHLKIEGKFRGGAKCPLCGAASFYPAHEKFTCWDGVTNPAPCAWCDELHYLGGEMKEAVGEPDI